MGGRASLIFVIGFGIVLGYINLNLARLTSGALSNMIGYNDITQSRGLANAGANVALARLTRNPWFRTAPGVPIIPSQKLKRDPFSGGTFTVFLDSISKNTLRLRSISTDTTNITIGRTGQRLALNDTVEVTLGSIIQKSFSTMEWMSIQEGNIFFITGDTLWGSVHSNGNIHIDGGPVFFGKVTTSGNIDPRPGRSSYGHTDTAKFLGGWETGVAQRPFPTDLTELKNNRSNVDSTSTRRLYVDLNPGTAADNDGYALVHKNSWTGQVIDSIPLSGFTDHVIYSSDTVHVKGTLDGRLSIASNKDLYIDSDIKYEEEPNPDNPADPRNNTTDMLGLIARNDVLISDNPENSAEHDKNGELIGPPNDLTLDASVFALKGSFTAQNYGSRGVEGRINLIGSIAQYDRGAIGNYSGGTIQNGYLKSYRYDKRLANPLVYPPSYPGFYARTLHVLNWWESNRNPEDFIDFQQQ